MFKRFHDAEKWDRPWYRKLSPVHKCFFDYITSKCDNVGVWIPDLETAEYFIGGAIDVDGFLQSVNGNIHILDNGKWWIVDFCRFQYPELTENSQSKPIQSYIALLKKHNLWIPYSNGMHTVQDKDKDKDKDIDKDKEKDIDSASSKTGHVYGKERNVKLTDDQFQHLQTTYGQSNAMAMIDELSEYKAMTGRKYQRDDLAIKKWVAKKVMDRVKSTTTPDLEKPPKEWMDNYESNYGSHT